MGKVTQRLTREDWILAGFRALVAGGAAALRVEPVARQLETTKGSFYWHFTDPADWRGAMLGYWEEMAFQAIVDQVSALPGGVARLQALADIAAAEGRDPAYGGTAAEPALRDWARYDQAVAGVVSRVDAGRIDFVAACFSDLGLDPDQAGQVARLFYAALLGLQALDGTASEVAADLRTLIGCLAPPAPA